MKPPVSIIVTTYNAEPFLLETLESARAQTYSDLELIISDDGSSDNTVRVARQWLATHHARFKRTEILTVPQNTGVSANCNRCLTAARTDWIKFIAGDDILLPGCIEDNMAFAEQHPEAKILFSYVDVYRNTFATKDYLKTIPPHFPIHIMNPEFTAEDQFKRLLLSDRISFTPSYFFHKSALTEVGGYDELHRTVEDYPMWLKLTSRGHKLWFFEKVTVGYRQHEKAFNNSGVQQLFSRSTVSLFPFRLRYVHQFLPWDIVMEERWAIAIAKLFVALRLTAATSVNRACFKFFSIYLNPWRYLLFVKKKLKMGDPVLYQHI